MTIQFIAQKHSEIIKKKEVHQSLLFSVHMYFYIRFLLKSHKIKCTTTSLKKKKKGRVGCCNNNYRHTASHVLCPTACSSTYL